MKKFIVITAVISVICIIAVISFSKKPIETHESVFANNQSILIYSGISKEFH